jgi:hypothetical protein
MCRRFGAAAQIFDSLTSIPARLNYRAEFSIRTLLIPAATSNSVFTVHLFPGCAVGFINKGMDEAVWLQLSVRALIGRFRVSFGTSEPGPVGGANSSGELQAFFECSCTS